MPQLKEWIKQKENKRVLIKMLAALCFPLLLCILYCLREGAWIGELYLANSMNNDALFYYKQVEGMVEYGIPQGYFGYDESAALKWSFGAWGPVVLVPWAIWGKVFGWTMVSPFICNIVLLSIVLALFVWWVRPGAKQMAVSAVMIALFPAITRYLMACLAEATIFCYVLAFYGLAIGYARRESRGRLVGMFVIASILVWLRPYMALLLLLPGLFLFFRNKVAGFVTTVMLGLGNVGIYFLLSHFFTPEYFLEMFDFALVTTFFTDGIGAGFSYLTSQFGYWVRTLLEYMGLSVTTGKFLGSNYWILFLICGLMLTLICRLWKQKEKLYAWICIHFVFVSGSCVAVMLLLMQKINESSRHIMAFILVGMLLLGCTCEVKLKTLWKPAIIALMCIYLYHYFPDDGQDYQVPIYTRDAYEEQMVWQEINQLIELEITGEPSFDNTLIWVFSDKVDGETVHMQWQHMLSVPAGMGINCCTDTYLAANWENIMSRYITTLADGEIAKLCEDSGFVKLGESGGNVLYKRY